jgi:thioesterase domain-containing protein
VKVRGFRVELGEVEATLMRHPQAREAAVIAKLAAGETRLIAYVAGLEESEPPTPEELRRHMREYLPEYMVPAAFVLLPALPRTIGGKIDRRALPAPPSERPAPDRPYVAPRTLLEEFLAGLWREVLQVETVGAFDHFFELGGSSIQGAMLINRLQQRLGARVYVVALFDSPTVAGLAHYLGEALPDTIREQFGQESLAARPSAAAGPGVTHRPGPKELVVALQAEGALPGWFMIHPPGGIVVCYQPLARHLGRTRPFYGIRSRGLHGEEELPGRMEAMAAEYVAAVRAVQPRGPYHLGGWSAGGLVALEMAQQLLAQGESIALLALLDTTPSDRPGSDSDQASSGREYGLDLSLAALARLGPEEQLPYLWQHALNLGLIEPEVPLQVAEQVLNELKRLFHHHMVLADEYLVRPYPGRITLLRPSEAPFAVATPRDRGWAKFAAAVDIHFVPGQHHSMVKEPHVQTLAWRLNECLTSAVSTITPETPDRFALAPLRKPTA